MLKLVRSSSTDEPDVHEDDPLLVLAQAARAGDVGATRQLVLAVGPTILRAVRRVLGPRHPDVEDVVQEATFALLASLAGFRGECSLRHFSGRVAVLPRRVRLYFVNAGSGRYLLRVVLLPGGLDEPGNQSVAQVIESSVTVLLSDAAAGLTLDEARRKITPATPASDPVTRRAAASEPPGNRLALSAHYTAVAFGPERLFTHGPGLSLALHRLLGAPALLRLAAAWHLPGDLDLSPIGAEIQMFPVRVGGAFAVLSSRRAGLDLGVRGGLDFVRVSPHSSLQGATLQGEQLALIPNAGLALTAELRFGALSLCGGPTLDVALADTHFDVQSRDRRVEVARVWRFRPGVDLSLQHLF